MNKKVRNSKVKSRNSIAKIAVSGHKIGILRREKGLSVERLAELSGYKMSSLWFLEKRIKSYIPSVRLGRIAAALGVSPEDLQAVEPPSTGLDAADWQFIDCFFRANPATKAKILRTLAIWIEDDPAAGPGLGERGPRKATRQPRPDGGADDR